MASINHTKNADVVGRHLSLPVSSFPAFIRPLGSRSLLSFLLLSSSALTSRSLRRNASPSSSNSRMSWDIFFFFFACLPGDSPRFIHQRGIRGRERNAAKICPREEKGGEGGGRARAEAGGGEWSLSLCSRARTRVTPINNKKPLSMRRRDVEKRDDVRECVSRARINETFPKIFTRGRIVRPHPRRIQCVRVKNTHY